MFNKEDYEKQDHVCPKCRSEIEESYKGARCLNCEWEGNFSQAVTKTTYYEIPKIIAVKYE